jgi:RNA polymerase sigma-70 factor, ECF subfamily
VRPDVAESPGPAQNAGPADAFEEHRRHLFGVAYRMLGSVAEAEDAVQEVYLRWQGRERSDIASPRAYLTTIVTRICLDQLKAARTRRENYVGLWLPEPLLEEPAHSPADALEVADDLTYSLLLMLERLSPLERAAFLLHDVFDLGFAEVAATLDRDEAACRQLATRARRHIRTAGKRFTVESDEARRIAEAFLKASRQGDTAALSTMLAEDVQIHSDGGGVRMAFLNVIRGREKVERAFSRLAAKAGGALPDILYSGIINAAPGLVTVEADGLPQATILEIENGLIKSIYIMRNPEKLGRLTALVETSGAN